MPRAHRPSSPECWGEAVRLARGSDTSIPALAADPGVSSAALRHADADAGRGQPGDPTTDGRDERCRVLQRERATPKKAAASCAQEAACAGTGSSTRRGLAIRSRSRAGCCTSPARRATPGPAAGSRPAPDPLRRSPGGLRRPTHSAGAPTAPRASRPRGARRASAPPGSASRACCGRPGWSGASADAGSAPPSLSRRAHLHRAQSRPPVDRR